MDTKTETADTQQNNSDTQQSAFSSDVPAGLTIPPEGVRVYTKRNSGKRLVTLHYRKRDSSISAALSFVGRVMADLDAAGVPLRGDVAVRMSPDKGGRRFGCVIDVEIGEEATQEE